MEEKKIQPNFDRVQLTQYQPVAASERIDRGGHIAYGDENDYPQYLKTLASTSPVHGALVKGIAKMVAGKRLTSSNPSDDITIEKYRLNRLVPSIANDIVMYGGFYTEYIKTLDRTGVAAVQRCCWGSGGGGGARSLCVVVMVSLMWLVVGSVVVS